MANAAESARLLLIEGGMDAGLIKIGTMPTKPEAVVVVVDAPGQSPNPKWLLDYPALQILVRGGKDDYPGAKATANLIKDLLLGMYSRNVGPDNERWVSVLMRGDVNYIGPDENSRPIFSLNFGLIIEPAVTPFTNREPLPE